MYRRQSSYNMSIVYLFLASKFLITHKLVRRHKHAGGYDKYGMMLAMPIQALSKSINPLGAFGAFSYFSPHLQVTR